VSALLVSDREREYTVDLLRGHWLSGRLTAEEFEQRVGEACRARFAADLWQALRALPLPAPAAAAPRRQSESRSGAASLVLGIVTLCMFFFSFGLLFFFTLPLAITAWALGRSARRSGAGGAAAAGEALGIVGMALSLLPFAAIAALVGLI
jgi:cbb3-type cytochrome oxidase subunit 3